MNKTSKICSSSFCGLCLFTSVLVWPPTGRKKAMNTSLPGHVLCPCTNLPWLPTANQGEPILPSRARKASQDLAQLSFLAQFLSSSFQHTPKPGTTAAPERTPLSSQLSLLTPGPARGMLGKDRVALV